MDFEQTHTKDVTAILPSRTRLLEGLKTPAAGEQNEQNTAKYSKVAFGESPKAFAYFAILLVLLSVFHFCFFCPFCFFCYPYFAFALRISFERQAFLFQAVSAPQGVFRQKQQDDQRQDRHGWQAGGIQALPGNMLRLRQSAPVDRCLQDLPARNASDVSH